MQVQWHANYDSDLLIRSLAPQLIDPLLARARDFPFLREHADSVEKKRKRQEELFNAFKAQRALQELDEAVKEQESRADTTVKDTAP